MPLQDHGHTKHYGVQGGLAARREVPVLPASGLGSGNTDLFPQGHSVLSLPPWASVPVSSGVPPNTPSSPISFPLHLTSAKACLPEPGTSRGCPASLTHHSCCTSEDVLVPIPPPHTSILQARGSVSAVTPRSKANVQRARGSTTRGHKVWLWSVNPVVPLTCLVTLSTCASASLLVKVG